jgi:hypothetical protein
VFVEAPATRCARALPGTEHLANYTVSETHSHSTHQRGSSVSAYIADPRIPGSMPHPDGRLSSTHGSSDLSDTPSARPSNRSKSKDWQDLISDDNMVDNDESEGEDSPEGAISQLSSPNSGEPSHIETEYAKIQKRKALEEELCKLNESEAEAAVKKRKLVSSSQTRIHTTVILYGTGKTLCGPPHNS